MADIVDKNLSDFGTDKDTFVNVIFKHAEQLLFVGNSQH